MTPAPAGNSVATQIHRIGGNARRPQRLTERRVAPTMFAQAVHDIHPGARPIHFPGAIQQGDAARLDAADLYRYRMSLSLGSAHAPTLPHGSSRGTPPSNRWSGTVRCRAPPPKTR